MRRTVRTTSSDGTMNEPVSNSKTEFNDVITDAPGGLSKTIESVAKDPDKNPVSKVSMEDDLEARIIGTPIDHERSRYPYCIVWTPLPFITWLIPIIGHMGIAYSSGVIRDFAGPYYVSEDHMAFGVPTKYWELNPNLAIGGSAGWDRAIYEASEEYKSHMHNICCDNCHSHCAYALNTMSYKGSKSWNMIWLFWFMLIYGKYVSCWAFLKTWGPFIVIATLITAFSLWRI